jgi:multidrug efflux pump subunit AcrB
MAAMRATPRAAEGVLGYFARHPTVANLLLVVLVVLGLAAAPQMRAQFFPDVIVDEVVVSVGWQGAGAEDVDAAIVQLLEPALLAVEGVSETSAVAREGQATITIEFEPGWDMARAADDVKTRVDAITELPEDADDPTVRRGAWRDRVTDIVITGPLPVEQLGRFADELSTRLFAAGVTRVSIRGLAAPQTVVEVDEAALIGHDVTLSQIAAAIRAEAEADPAGDVAGGTARVRTGVEKRSSEEIAAIVLRAGPDGSKLRIGDVARIRVDGPDRERAYFAGPDPALSIRVDRSEAGDAIEIQQTVEQVAAALQADLPQGVTIELIRTRAEAITTRIGILLDNGMLGLMLVVTLLFLFLNARTAFWVAAGIPVAMLATIALMYAAGLTLNMISLFALIITLGIVVDDAIVVGEHADFRARLLGEPATDAAVNAARRMAPPVFSATVTTVIAFFALVAVGGRFGDLIKDIPFTVITVLIASLIECFLILPNHMAHALKPRPLRGAGALRTFLGLVGVVAVGLAGLVTAGFILLALPAALTSIWIALTGLEDWALGAVDLWAADQRAAIAAQPLAVAAWLAGGVALATVLGLAAIGRRRRDAALAVLRHNGINTASLLVNRGLGRFRMRLFRPGIRLVIWARYPVLAATLLLLASQIALVIDGKVGWRFFNAPELGSVSGNFAMAQGATRDDSLAMMRELQRAAEAVAVRYQDETGVALIDYALGEIGGNTGRGLAGAETKDRDLLGGIAIELIDADLRPGYSSFDFVADLQQEVVRPPLLEELSFRGWRGGPGGDSLSVDFFGANAETLKAAAEALKTAVAQYPEVSAVEDSLAYDKEELILELTPRGAALGLSVDALGRALRDRLTGIEAASFPDGPRTATIRVELPDRALSADFLERTMMRTAAGDYVPLADIVAVTSRGGFSTVRRENGLRVVSVTGDIAEDDPERATLIEEALRQTILPDIEARFGVASRMTGLAEQERAFLADAQTGLILCLLGIYLVLAWIFASWSRPAVVMAIIPFGLVGAIWGHYIWDVPLSMFSVVGLLGMVGIIINDSIVLVTTIDEYAEERGLFPAIIDGAADRLRPVLLTTLTTVLGLAPLLYETSMQAQFLKPTVITLCYGLGFGMALVLVVVPALMAMQADLARARAALRRALRGRRGSGPAGFAVRIAGAAMAALFVATLGWTLVTGAMAPPLVGLLQGVPLPEGTGGALAVFALGAVLVAVAVHFVTAALWAAARRG